MLSISVVLRRVDQALVVALVALALAMLVVDLAAHPVEGMGDSYYSV